MASTTFRNIIRVGSTDANKGNVVLAQFGTITPTAAAGSQTVATLPKGARVLYFAVDGSATGGSNPTVDIGITGTTAKYANEVDADSGDTLVASLDTTVVTSETVIVAGAGSSAATGGTVGIVTFYTIDASSSAGYGES